MRRLRRAHQRNATEQTKRRKKFKQRAIAAGAAAAITLGAGVALNTALAHTPDPHELHVSQDADGDLLADAEEIAIDSDVLNPDQNTNAIPDGIELAKRCFADINELPWQNEASPGETYKWLASQWGLETCDICGAQVTMGPGGIVNPRLGISVQCNLITIHYMQHGSFSYSGDVSGAGRVDVPALVQALELPLPYDPKAHQLPVAEDTDGDLLTDNEEKALAYLPFNPDQNRNGTLDGVELARLCETDINDLPTWDPQSGDPEPNQTYKWYKLTFGLETCDICGQQFNMGGVVVVNPNRSLTVSCPFISLHYMEHGSYSYAGSTNKGRLDVPTLLQALELRLPCEPNDHQLPVPKDPDKDLLANKEEFAIGYKPFNDDQNKNEIPDGVELAKRLAADVNDLPRWDGQGDPPNETYKIEHALDGLEQCGICGRLIHMGGGEIKNPKLGLSYPDPNDPLEKMFLPDLALHYMKHGSFDCYGSYHTGRVNLQRLMRVLERRFPYDPNEHRLPVDANDLDSDLLADSEELAAGYNLYDPDQDQDLIPDGIELAKQCGEAVNELPVYDPYSGDPPPKQTYKVNFFQKGLERCGVCGAMRNMGWWQVINPKLGLSIEVPDIVCHYMEHGSFSYAGDVHGKGRIDVPLLGKILEMPRCCGDLGTVYLPGDLNEDCSENFKDIAEVADKWLECTDPGRDECDKL
ncbi:MAG TPA: hypothetical protein VMY06_03870 [Sedimentisphaerales bacterium]|nr:hypothetical protein [Sedimentisphaerales bacterium]